jgi:5-deoxy-5-amino-3-dehydroquinate synthase
VSRVDEHFEVVGVEYGLATDVPQGLEAGPLLELMRKDKKALDGLTFVLDGSDGVEVVPGVADEPVLAALARML